MKGMPHGVGWLVSWLVTWLLSIKGRKIDVVPFCKDSTIFLSRLLGGNNSDLHCGSISFLRYFLQYVQPNAGPAPPKDTNLLLAKPPWYPAITFDTTESLLC
jgi:hypothetical protein